MRGMRERSSRAASDLVPCALYGPLAEVNEERQTGCVGRQATAHHRFSHSLLSTLCDHSKGLFCSDLSFSSLKQEKGSHVSQVSLKLTM